MNLSIWRIDVRGKLLSHLRGLLDRQTDQSPGANEFPHHTPTTLETGDEHSDRRASELKFRIPPLNEKLAALFFAGSTAEPPQPPSRLQNYRQVQPARAHLVDVGPSRR